MLFVFKTLRQNSKKLIKYYSFFLLIADNFRVYLAKVKHYVIIDNKI